MTRNRQSKLVAIIALCVSVVGLTLGFAAFSNTLTISSSATVSPNASDFKLVVYGVPSIGEYDQAAANSADYRDAIAGPISKYTSTTTSMPIMFYDSDPRYDTNALESNASTNAVITNNGNGSISMSNLSVTFTEPNQGVEYYFLIKNEGHYDAYVNILNQQLPSHTCTPDPGTTASYVEKVCENINIQTYLGIANDDGTYKRVGEEIIQYIDEKGNLKVPVGGHLYFIVRLDYLREERADGPFSVKWDDMNVTFTTNAQ